MLYYTRGIANERAGDWPAAEADFRQALELQPDQPLVLNYLGYSLVEQRENLDEALGMIERAVRGQPDDGYITDSLGWVLYRLGRYDEAVPHMLRAVELVPDDPIINDHLGDVLWKVGRKREAEFQWRRALSFGPADDLDMDRVRRSSRSGSTQVLAAEPARRTAEPSARRATAELAPAKVNLALHVTGRRADGYHLLDSLVVFPELGDRRRGGAGRRACRWPSTARSRRGSTPAPRTWCCARPRCCAPPGRGAALRPDQVAAGRRAASAAAPRTPRRRCGCWRGSGGCRCPAPTAVLALGADVPVCLAGARLPDARHRRAARAARRCRRFWLVLVNPGVPVADRRGLRRARRAATTRRCPTRPASPTPPRSSPSSPRQRNDLEAPAIAAARPIAEALAALAAQPGCRLARMSGSGATCFGAFAARAPALAAAAALRRARPAWWVAAAPVAPR